MERWRWCVVITPPPFFFVMWPKVHFRVMSSTSKITKGDKQMYLMWTVPITHLRHVFIQCCASFPLLRWEYLYAMAAAIKNMGFSRYLTPISNKKIRGVTSTRLACASLVPISPRFLCRLTAFYGFSVAVGRQSAIYTENGGFASPALGRHISTFRGYRILFSIRNPYINRFTNHFCIHS